MSGDIEFKASSAVESEDIVCSKFGPTLKFGFVTQSYNDDSSSDDNDEQEGKVSKKIQEGFAKVAWFDVAFGDGQERAEKVKGQAGTEQQVVAENKLKVVDRAIMPGDAVRRTKFKNNGEYTPQRGFVKKVNLMFDVAMLCNRNLRLYNVPAERFLSPVPYTVGCFCVYNFYLGEIEQVRNIIRFELRDGFVYEVKESILRRYATDTHDHADKQSYFHKNFFYPNQEIKINSKVLNKSLCILASSNHQYQQFEGLQKPKLLKARIDSIHTDSIRVSWVLRCYSGGIEDTHLNVPDDEESIPPSDLFSSDLKKLKVLSDFVHLSYSLGDNAILQLTETDLKMMKNVAQKFHCGGAVKDHIIDMETKQLCRNKYGSRFGKKKVMSRRVYHASQILPDSYLDVRVPIPTNLGETTTTENVLENLRSILKMNKISHPDETVLRSLASRYMFFCAKTFTRDDLPSLIVELLNSLQSRGFTREHGMVRYFMNRRTRITNFLDDDEKLDADASSSFLQDLEAQQFESTPHNYLMVDDPSNVNFSNTKDITKNEASSVEQPEVKHKPQAENVELITIQHHDKDSDSTTSHKPSTGPNYTTYYDQYVGSTTLYQNLKSVYSNLPDEELVPHLVSTMDLANCMGNIMDTWDGIMTRRDPNWKSRVSQQPDSSRNSSTATGSSSTEAEPSANHSLMYFANGAANNYWPSDDITDDVTASQSKTSQSGETLEQRDPNNTPADPSDPQGDLVVPELGRVPVRDLLTFNPGDATAFKVIMTRTFVTVMWQDGTLEAEIPATEVETMHNLDENEFFPGDLVNDTRQESVEEEKYGVVQRAHFQDRTALVRWFSDNNQDRMKYLGEEEVSVYDISDVGHLDLNVLDIVARVSGVGERPLVDQHTGRLQPLPRTGTAGAVIDVQLDTGLVHVMWIEGYHSLVPHHCLININDSEMITVLIEEQIGEFSSDDDEDPNQQMAILMADYLGLNNPDDFTGITLEATQLGEVEGEETEGGGEYTKESSGGDKTSGEEKSTTGDEKTSSTEDDPDLPEGMTKIKLHSSHFETIEHSESPENLSIPCSPGKKIVAHLCEQFAKFEILPAVKCHKFITSTDIPQSKLFLTTLKKELKVLSTALPDGILVRTFEDRNDLFSCLIVGAEETPYEQGLFLFDIKLPVNYPAEPPSVLYLSYSNGKLNPNLYEDGKICLSLLGTWIGKGTEVWSKDASSLLQLFVSLQALILNKTPYFNEAGYEKQRALLTGQENAKMYNEMVIIRLVEACTALITTPYETFEREILEHFRFVAWNLIDRLQLWCDTPDSKTLPSPNFPLFPLSAGFRRSLLRELAKFKSAVYKMFKMLPHYDEGSVEQQHQASRLTGTKGVGRHLVEETNSQMDSNASLTLDKIEVNYLRHNIMPLDEDTERFNTALSEWVVYEPTLRSISNSMSDVPKEKSYVGTSSTNGNDADGEEIEEKSASFVNSDVSQDSQPEEKTLMGEGEGVNRRKSSRPKRKSRAGKWANKKNNPNPQPPQE